MRRRRTREAEDRAVRAGLLPPLQCGSCGQRFWTDDQRRAHYGSSDGRAYCVYSPVPLKRPDQH